MVYFLQTARFLLFGNVIMGATIGRSHIGKSLMTFAAPKAASVYRRVCSMKSIFWPYDISLIRQV